MSAIEGGRGVCWADQKEEPKEDAYPVISETVILSPLTESDVRLDVPPVSVLSQTRLAAILSDENPTTSVQTTNLDSTIVLRPAELDVTFDMNSGPSEALEQIDHRVCYFLSLLNHSCS